MDCVPENLVMDLVQQGRTDTEISEHLRYLYPGVSAGLSKHSVKKWRLTRKVLKRESLPDSEVDNLVRRAVGDIGVLSGRRFVRGYIISTYNKHVSEGRVGESLRRCFPDAHGERLYHARQHFNPVPYHADYFGHRLHMDQNEKLVNFGATHVAAVDGYSGFVVAHATMPVKNNIVIYDKVYKKALVEHGLWDQVCVDHGKEFYLSLSYQEYLKDYRHNTSRKPFIQIESTKNNRVERLWVETNQRVNFPIKRALENLVQLGVIDRDSANHRFAVSHCACEVSAVGLERLFRARNARYCRKRGIPAVLMSENNQAAPVNPALVMGADAAAQSYRQNGGTLTDPWTFGQDPASGNQVLLNQRQDCIKSFRFSPCEVYSLLASGQSGAFEAYVVHTIGAVEQFQ